MIETTVRDFTGNWTGTGAISGAGDAEKVCLNSGEYMVSELVYTGAVTVTVLQNTYDGTGDDVDLEYRHGATPDACVVAGWNTYSVPFASLGYIQVRMSYEFIYLLRDDFVTAEGAPIASPRTCEPGPGTLTIVNTVTGGSISISSSNLVMSQPSGGQSYTGYGFYSATGHSRSVGRALYALAVQSSGIDRFTPVVWNNSAAMSQHGKAKILFNNTASLAILSGTGGDLTVGTSLTNNTPYNLAIIARSTGYVFLIKGGTQYSAWTVLYVSMQGVDATLYPLLNNYNAAIQLGEFGVYNTVDDLATDYGWCTSFDATPTANDTATGEADGWDYFTWTPAAAETLSLYFRRTDDDNTYRLDCAQVGGTIKLYRREGASDTELDSGKTQTWTAGAQYRIGIRHIGGSIMTTVEYSDGSFAKHSVTGETYNLAVTGIKCAGFAAGANWETYPATLSGSGITDLAL